MALQDPSRAAKIYRLAQALQDVPYDEEVSPHQLQARSGVHRDTIPTYVHHAIMYQNFWPRIAMNFETGTAGVDRVRIIKRSPPAAFGLCFSPWESLYLKLFELGAYGGRSIVIDKVQTTGPEKRALEVLTESKDIEIQRDRIWLTPKGLSDAFLTFDRYCALRAQTFADLRNSAGSLDLPGIVSRPEYVVSEVLVTSPIRRESLNILHNNRVISSPIRVRS